MKYVLHTVFAAVISLALLACSEGGGEAAQEEEVATINVELIGAVQGVDGYAGYGTPICGVRYRITNDTESRLERLSGRITINNMSATFDDRYGVGALATGNMHEFVLREEHGLQGGRCTNLPIAPEVSISVDRCSLEATTEGECKAIVTASAIGAYMMRPQY